MFKENVDKKMKNQLIKLKELNCKVNERKKRILGLQKLKNKLVMKLIKFLW